MQPTSLMQMRSRIARAHESLPRRLREVSSYVEANPQSVALDTLAQIADKAGVHPSTLVRFANHFEFSGFSELQKLYKEHIQRNFTDYGESAVLPQAQANDSIDAAQLLDEFARANVESMQTLRKQLDADRLNAAVHMLAEAPFIHICGVRRAYPAVMYFSYALRQLQVRNQTIDGLGLMHNEQVGKGELLIAISFAPHAEATRIVARQAHQAGARVLLITDDPGCSSSDYADISLCVDDAVVRSLRSLNATLCLVQTLCIALAHRKTHG